jgi:hypothetical protein
MQGGASPRTNVCYRGVPNPGPHAALLIVGGKGQAPWRLNSPADQKLQLCYLADEMDGNHQNRFSNSFLWYYEGYCNAW